MATLTIEVPAEHLSWIREQIKELACADRDNFPHYVSDDLTSRAPFEEAWTLLNRSLNALDQIGWEGPAVDVSLSMPTADLQYLVSEALMGFEEDVKVASGHYPSHKRDDAEVARVKARFAWLTRERDRISEAVTV